MLPRPLKSTLFPYTTLFRSEKKRYMFNVPLFSQSLSKLWLRLITQTPKEIVYPLVESLTHEMIVQDSKYVKEISDGKIPFAKLPKLLSIQIKTIVRLGKKELSVH